jgi:hypothetical protein
VFPLLNTDPPLKYRCLLHWIQAFSSLSIKKFTLYYI